MQLLKFIKDRVNKSNETVIKSYETIFFLDPDDTTTSKIIQIITKTSICIIVIIFIIFLFSNDT
jgi:hypothetical protein